MKSVYKNLKKIFLLVTIIGSLFNSVYACRTAKEILDDCTDFYNEPQQRHGFIFKEEARLCIEKVNGLLGDIEEFCTSTAIIITEKVEASRSWLRLQEVYLELSRAEAHLFLQPEDKEAFEFLKMQARMGNLDLRHYLAGGRSEGSLSECQIDELLTILQKSINSTDYLECIRIDLIIRKPLNKHLCNKSQKNFLQRGEIIKLKEKGFLEDWEASDWIEVLERRHEEL